jgi:hypothetical protein
MGMFQPIRKAKTKLRATLVGPSGSGKSYTAMELAIGLVGPGGRIAVIDTESGSIAKSLPPIPAGVATEAVQLGTFNPLNYVEMIKAAEAERFDLIIIDSLSHAWFGPGGLLDFVEQNKKRYSNNSYVAWKDATPLHNTLINAILNCSVHVIATMRSKVEFVIETDSTTGKSAPVKVGMAPIQREGMDYEFDLQADMDVNHNLIVTKARALFGEFDRQVISKPTRDIGRRLAQLCNEGIDAPARSVGHRLDDDTAAKVAGLASSLQLSDQQFLAILGRRGASDVRQLSASDADEIIQRLTEKLAATTQKDRDANLRTEDAREFGERLDESHAEMAADKAAAVAVESN